MRIMYDAIYNYVVLLWYIVTASITLFKCEDTRINQVKLTVNQMLNMHVISKLF